MASGEAVVARSDLKSLLEAYERNLILDALTQVGGCQRNAAALLRILPTTLNEKMKRLDIGRRRMPRPEPESGDEVCASLTWQGRLPPGGTLEVRGFNGAVRVEHATGDRTEVLATRRGHRDAVAAAEVRVVEHAGGVTLCLAVPAWAAAASRQLARPEVRVEVVARVPSGVRVVASSVEHEFEATGPARVLAGPGLPLPK